jgi:hypothetical protein
MSTTMTEPMDEAQLHEFVMKAVGGNGGHTRYQSFAEGAAFGGAFKVWCEWFDGTKKMNEVISPESLKLAD